MRNTITLNGVTYDDDALRGVSVDADVSLDGRTLDVDTLEATVEGTDALTEISRSAPLRFLRGGNPRSVWYAQRVEQIAPALFRVSATSSLGRLAQMSHRGGLYTGQPAGDVIDSICGTIPHRVSSTYAARPIYGWLPYVSPSGEASAQTGSAKDNLLQVLFALGAFLRADEDGTLVIGELAATSQSVIGPDRIYANGAWVEHEEPVTAVTVLEHQWTPGTDTVTLFDGTATAGQVVIFDEPMGSLAATGITILESGANFAVLGAGTGKVTGIPYLHQTRGVSQTLASEAIPNTVRVEDATLVSAVNSTEVVERLAAYHSHKTWICCDAQIETEAAGDRVSIFDPFAKVQKDATLQQIYNLQASTVLRGSLRALVGFEPPAPDDAEQVTELLTGSGTWTVPPGVTEISAVLIGGGQGASRGADGGGHEEGAGWWTNRAYGCVGGDPGNAGHGGMIRRVSLQVEAGDTIHFVCGAGGAASERVGGTGEEGEATTLGDYSSAAGDYFPGGVLELTTNTIYGSDGVAGVRGNDGTGLAPGSLWGSEIVTPDPIVVDGISYANGGRDETTVEAHNGSMHGYLHAGYGGGAAYKANGGYAPNGTIEIAPNIYGEWRVFFRDMIAGRGADAQPPKTPNYGQGGSAGHGGGGAGAYGDYEAQGAPANPVPEPTAGGSGSAGTAGGDGCIILSYRIPAQQRALVSIAITTPPTKTAYTAGETFDRTGMVVTATYSDGTTAPVTGYTVSPSGALTTSDTAVTISYTAGTVTRTATQTITVTPAAVTLVSIAITTPPTKTTYTAGESFARAGMVVTASYSDGSTAPVTGYTVTPSGALSTSNAYVTLSYTEGGITCTARQAITVQAAPVTGYTAYTSAQTGVTYTDGIAGLTNAQLSDVAKAISNNSSISRTTTECWVSGVDRHITVGDQISITINSTAYAWRLMSLNHYDLTDAQAYGTTTASGKAGLTIQTIDCLPDAVVAGANTGVGYSELPLRSTVQALTLPTGLPVHAVNLLCATSVSDATIMTVSDSIFLPSLIEVSGETSAVGGAGEGSRYRWYTINFDASDRIKETGGAAIPWWTRSCATIRLGSNRQYAIGETGNVVASNRTATRYLAPCICI